MHHIFLEQCDSTQSSFKEIWSKREFTGSYLLVSTQKQINGIGRRSNQWFSGKDSLAMSCSVHAQKNITLTPLALGLAVVEFFAKKNINIKVKWPNDLLNDQGQKVGGILCQTLKDDLVLAGIGLNLFLDQNEQEKVSEFDYPVGHLNLKDSNREKLAFELYQDLINIPEFDAKIWNQHCAHLNSRVTIKDDETVDEGVFIGIDHDGAAILKSNEGTEKRLFTGSLRVIASR